MKLELKHLAPYLPHKLSGIFRGRKESLKSCTTVFINREILYGDFKPILIPLRYFYNKPGKAYMDMLGCQLSIVHEIWELSDGRRPLNDVSLLTYLVMCRNHIDFNELIKKGLAVDINTL